MSRPPLLWRRGLCPTRTRTAADCADFADWNASSGLTGPQSAKSAQSAAVPPTFSFVGQSPSRNRVAAHQENAAKPPLKAQTGWSVQNDHPVRAFLTFEARPP